VQGRVAIAYPWTGSTATAFRINRSSVPCGRSDFSVAMNTSAFYRYSMQTKHRSAMAEVFLFAGISHTPDNPRAIVGDE
jgi:hypothetical protein